MNDAISLGGGGHFALHLDEDLYVIRFPFYLYIMKLDLHFVAGKGKL
jgi:hypothetical protein